MKVSIIIPVKNAEKTLPLLLDSLMNQTYKPYEVIVVDDGSTDKSPQIAKKYGVKILYTNGTKGPNYARNLGVKHAQGEIIVFTDADCVPKDDWIENIVKEFNSNNEIVAVSGSTYAYNKDNFWSRFLENSILTPTPKYFKKIILSEDFKPPTIVATCNFAVRREVFQKIGLFDPSFKYYGSDDMDFVYRILKKRAGKIICSPEPIVFHVHRTSPIKILRRYFQYGMGFSLFKKKHPESIFSKLVATGVYLFISLMISAFVLLFFKPFLSLSLLLIPLILIALFHVTKLIKEKRLEELIYPFLDYLLVIVSCLGVVYMALKLKGKPKKSLYSHNLTPYLEAPVA